MAVYFEYVFIENFCLDFTLLTLSFLLCKTKITWWKMVISAILGAGCACVSTLAFAWNFADFLKDSGGFFVVFTPFSADKKQKRVGEVCAEYRCVFCRHLFLRRRAHRLFFGNFSAKNACVLGGDRLCRFVRLHRYNNAKIIRKAKNFSLDLSL